MSNPTCIGCNKPRDQDRRHGGTMKIVYICSPLRGDGSPEAIRKNIQRARNYCEDALKERVIPIAPHIYFTQFLDDRIPEQRMLGLKMGLELLTVCHEIWVYGKYKISEGMQAEIDFAERIGLPVMYKEAK